MKKTYKIDVDCANLHTDIDNHRNILYNTTKHMNNCSYDKT